MKVNFPMKTSLLIAVASGALLLSAPALAQAQGQQPRGDIFQQLLGSVFGTNPQASEQTLESDWNQGRRPFAQRRDALEARIDTAVRDGSIGRREADQMREEYEDIVDLEAEYSADGSVSQQQRQDLRARYRALAQRVGGQGGGQGSDPRYPQTGSRDDRPWQPLSTRNSAFEQRVATGLRNRNLTNAEALRLRTDWRALAQVEASYQRGGIDSREEADLWARYNAISSRLGADYDRDTTRWRQLETRLAAAEQNGRMTRNQAVQVRAQLGDLARLDAVYAVGGYNTDQRAYLARRYADLDQMLGYDRR